MADWSLFQVDDFVLSEVVKTFNRSEKSLNEDVENLKKWMKTQPHLPEIMDGKVIHNFLLLNKCRIEETKSRIDSYYTVRTIIDQLVKDYNPRGASQKVVTKGLYVVALPKLTEEIYRVFFLKGRNKEVLDNVEPYHVAGRIFNLLEIRMKEDVYFGDIVVIDCKNVGFKFLVKITPQVLYNCITLYEKVFSLRIKAVYVINAPPLVEKLVVIIKTFLKPKVKDRVHICHDPNVIRQKFSKILPRDYGGEEMSLEELQELVDAKFVQYQERFDQLDKLRVNEKLRPEKLENGHLGYYGNFKKLEFD